MNSPSLDTNAADFLVAAAERVNAGYPELFRHQTTGVAFLLSRRKAILADDMGLGKTRTAIVSAREHSTDGRVLVIAPASVKLGWKREIQLVEPDAAVDVLEKGEPETPGRWTVINYDRLARFSEYLQKLRPSVIIVDEAHAIKNKSTRSSRTLGLIAANPDAAVYLLTGTPMMNRPRDLFNLLKAIDHPSAKSFFSFAKRYCAAEENGYGLDTNGASNVDELAKVVSGVMLRRTKDEALDLPEKIRTWLPIEAVKPKVTSLEARALEYLGKNPSRDGETWITFLGLLNKARHELAISKAESTATFVADLVEAGQKVVVFTAYQAVVDKLASVFANTSVTLTGSHSAKERDEAVQRYQSDSSIRVFIGNIQAAGTGITLTAGTHVVFNDLDWVPANHWQAEDRVYRIGQTQTAFATYLYAPGTLDEFVAALLETKARLVGAIEEEAEARSSMLSALVSATLDGVDVYASETTGGEYRGTVGLLEETLSLLESFASDQATNAQQGVVVLKFPSSSSPGTSYTVEIVNGVARCDCTGFTYRGNCSHARKALA